MPIAVTCECGSKLEIDEKFLGKQILCPDCQRPLPTQAPATPPPLELPDNRRVSGLALLSLILALVGAFTIVGTIAAVVAGVFALKQIAAKPTKLEGVNYARAGIGLGAFFTFLMLAILFTPTVFGIDSLMREMAFAGHVKYDARAVEGKNQDRNPIVLTRPSNRWAEYLSPSILTNNFLSNDLIMVNVADDAFIACQFVELNGDEDADTKVKLVLDKFYQSELVHLLGRLGGKPLDREGEIVEKKVVDGKNGSTIQEIILSLRLGGIDRRVLLQYSLKNQGIGMNVLIGVARRNRFDRLNEVFHKTFDSQDEK